MKPWRLGAGNAAFSLAARFNSATAVKPWRLYGLVDHRERMTRTLQFGHGGEAVETGEGILEVLGAGELQFGHGGEAGETRRSGLD